MVVIKQFFYYCSVRLGTVITANLTLIQLIALYIFNNLNHEFNDEHKSIADQENNNEHEHDFREAVNGFLENNLKKIVSLMNVFCSSCVVACFLAIFGAYKVR